MSQTAAAAAQAKQQQLQQQTLLQQSLQQGYMQQQQQQALEKQQNINAMEALNNLFVVAKQQEQQRQQQHQQQQQQQIRPTDGATAAPNSSQPIAIQPQAAAANQSAALKLSGGVSEPITAPIGGAVAVQVSHFIEFFLWADRRGRGTVLEVTKNIIPYFTSSKCNYFLPFPFSGRSNPSGGGHHCASHSSSATSGHATSAGNKTSTRGR